MKAIKIIKELLVLGYTEQCGMYTHSDSELESGYQSLCRMFGENLAIQYMDKLKDGAKYLYSYGAELSTKPTAIIIDSDNNEIGLYEIEE